MKNRAIRFVLLAMTICLLVGVRLAVPAKAATIVDSGSCGENATWTLDDQGTLTISGSGAIDNRAFCDRLDFNSVIIQNGITKIGELAFDSSSIENVIIPSSVTHIGNLAFNNSGLQSVSIPYGVTVIGSFAFASCSLKSVKIPSTVKIIRPGAFYDCCDLKSVSIPSSVTYIGADVFSDTGLQNVIIPNSVTSIGKFAFSNCDLVSIVIPKSVKVISEGAFYGCEKLEHVYFNGSRPSFLKEVFLGTSAYGIYHKGDASYSGAPRPSGMIKWVAAGSTAFANPSGHNGSIVRNEVTKATFSKNGKIVPVMDCDLCGEMKMEPKKIVRIGSVKLSDTSYVYDGTAKKPKVIVKDYADKTIDPKYYTVTYPSGRTNVGKYVVKVTFKGRYSGTKNLAFKIIPKTPTISKLAGGSKYFKAVWKKTAQTTGYQIRYITKGGTSKIVTIPDNTVLSKVVKNLSGGTDYQVRIRSYKTVNGVKFYSKWSAAKSVTTKK